MAKGKLKIIVNPRPRRIWSQDQDIISVRTEDNNHDITFHYENFDPVALSAMQVLYQEGIPNDPSQTYIVVASQQSQNITSSPGQLDLHIVTNGIATQLDKTLNFNLGTNPVTVHINFESRPDTMNMTKQTPSYQVPIQITQADIINNFSDFDGSNIVEVAIETGGTPKFKYDGQTYVNGQFVPINTIDSVGLWYYPENNPLGYTEEYFWLVKDDTGLITKA